jgi:cytochrome b5
VGGQDATEAFEDVGHSDEAREILNGLLIGTLKRGPNDPQPKTATTDKIAAGPGGAEKGSYGAMSGVGLYAVVLVGAAVAYGVYMYLQSSKDK